MNTPTTPGPVRTARQASAINRSILRIVLVYAVFASLWILLSDRLLAMLPLDAEAWMRWSMYKGWGFVAVSAALLTVLLHSHQRRQEDITNRLAESEERFRLVCNNLPDSYVYQFTLDQDGSPRFLFLSEGVERIHGLKAEDVMRDASLLHGQTSPSQLPALMAAQEQSTRDFTDFVMELSMQRPDGEWRWVRARSRPRRRADGQIIWDGVVSDITEQKNAERIILKANELLQQAGAMAGLGGWEFDTGTGKGSWTDEVARIHDLDPAVETNVELGLSFYPGKNRETIEAAVREAIEAAKPYDLELELLSAAGRKKWVRTAGRPVVEDGRVVKVRGIIQDITGIRQAEDELRSYREIFNSTTEAIFLEETSSGRILDVNDAMLKMYGYPSKEEVLALNIGDLSSNEAPFTEEEAQKRIAATLGGPPLQFDWLAKRRDGTIFPAEVTLRHSIIGGQSRVIAVVRDITERKRAETALRESELRYRQLFESNPHPMWLYDIETLGFLAVNDAAVAHYGYSRDEFLNMTIADILPGEDVPELLKYTSRVVEGGNKAGIWRHRRKDGSVILVEITTHTLRFDDRRAKLVLAHDVTERTLGERALIQAKEAAEAANEAKSAFLANMSHEIRTPLNGIMAMMQVLEMTGLDEEQKQYVTMALKSSDRLTRLLSDLLDLSRIESGKMVIREEEFTPTDLCDSVCELFAVSARNKDILLKRAIDPSVPPRLLGDESRVRQILFNLVGNAVKFTESGSVSLELTPLQAKGRTVRLLISVTDTGIGIHADQMNELFQPFTQVEDSYTRRFQGAGLGLSIVRRLVALLGGSIDMDSIPGEGTRVHVVLPFRLPAEGAAGTSGQPREAGKPGRRLRILLAEDDWSNAIATRTLLEKLGHAATLTRNGREAVEIAGREKFDVVFMDIQMPVMNGIDAARGIRARKNGPNADIPIIALTAYAMTGDKEKFLEAGMNAYLAKPLDLEELRKVLEPIVS